MFSSRCFKFTCSTRILLNKKPSVHNSLNLTKSNKLSCHCLSNQTSRLLFVKDSTKVWGKYGMTTASKLTRTDKELKPTDSRKDDNSNEELLERHIASLSTDLHQKNRVYKNDLLRVIAKVKELNFSTKKQGLLLLRCCTELLPEETPTNRMALAEQVWTIIKPHTKFDIDHYNELLRVYIANNKTMSVSKFMSHIHPNKPNITTYELILRTLGEAGDINQATEVIANMKSINMPATENIFNSLIICQGKAGNIKDIDEVLTMMKSLKLEKTADTYTAIARAFAFNKMDDQVIEELRKARSKGVKFEQTHIMEIVKTMTSYGIVTKISEALKFLPEEVLTTPSITPLMQSVSTLLVYQNQPMAALEIYKCLPLPSFGPKDDRGLHGRSLVRDCVKANVPSSLVALVTEELMSSGRNPIALQNACEAALQLGRVPLALDLFTRMKQLGLPLRPHYFWPVLIARSKSCGEKGIMSVLETMVNMSVMPDHETLMGFVLPHVSFTSPQNLMKKLQHAGLPASAVLTPMMETLLNTGQSRAASEICELFDAKVDVEKLVKPLLKAYHISFDVTSTIHILEDVREKAVDKNKDWVGRFMCAAVTSRRAKETLADLHHLLQAIKDRKIKISVSAADFCISKLGDKSKQPNVDEIKQLLMEITDDKLIDEGEMFTQQIPHPKQMGEESLKAHLVELEAKGMNTRGVLRKLLQEYCRSGDLAAARHVVDKCHKEGVLLSAGMKAAIFDLNVKLGDIEQAQLVLADLNKTSPNFLLDEYKIIDFATLMVYKGKIDAAFDLINEQSKKRHVVGGLNISMNCWRLLDAMAARAPPPTCRRMCELLTSLRYCAPTNAILGPLVRAHLKQNNLEGAVEEYMRISNKYKKTPLKHELICRVMEEMSDGRSEEVFISSQLTNTKWNTILNNVLAVDKKLHGTGSLQITIIAALADMGFKKTLRKVLLDPEVQFHADALTRRLDRFVEDRNARALETLAQCARDLRRIHLPTIYDMILDVIQRDNDYNKAVELWTRMQEAEITPSKKFVQNFVAFAKANLKEVPVEIQALDDSENKKSEQLSKLSRV